MRDALAAEWVKMRTVAGTWWLVLGLVITTMALSATVAVAVSGGADPNHDPVKLSLSGVDLGQAVVVILGVLVMSSEYSTGTIHSTMMAVPRRTSILLTKAVIVVGLVLAAGTVALLGGLISGLFIFRMNGFAQAAGQSMPGLADGATVRALCGSILYLVLIGLLSLGVATAVRDAAVAIGIVLGLLYMLPVLAALVGDPRWHRLLEQIAPMTAGLAIQSATSAAGAPIGPWAGLGVVAAWAAGALLVGGLLLRWRDT